jgi:hypothetical protein
LKKKAAPSVTGRNVRPARSEIHDEEAVHQVGRGEFVALAGSGAHQQFELRSGTMLTQDLKLNVIRIGQHELGRRLHLCVGGNPVSHHDHFHRRVR